MMYKPKVTVCSDNRTKHSKQSEHHVEFWILNLVLRKETARLWKVKFTHESVSVTVLLVLEKNEHRV